MSLDKSKFCYEMKVLKRIQETSDTVSLVLEVPRTTGGRFAYKAGQFVTLFLDINGEEVRRSYSLASSPDFETEFKITIKLVSGGKASTYLTQKVQVGDSLWATPPAGHFVLPQDIEGLNFGFYAAGSGITPIISLIKSALKTSSRSKCALLYQNRRDDNIIFRDELARLEREMSPRLQVRHLVSQPSSGWSGPTGRCDNQHIEKFVRDYNLENSSHHYACGPEGFMTVVEESLLKTGVNKSQFVKESFAAGVAHTPNPIESSTGSDVFELDSDAVIIGDRSKLSTPQTIIAVVDGKTHTVPYKNGKTVLECLLEADLNPPYSCLDGACMACIGKVQEGAVYQNDMGILTEDNIEASECLTCQARPASSTIKINYEIF